MSERARRIEQRRIIVEDPTLTPEVRGRAFVRKCELEREAEDE